MLLTQERVEALSRINRFAGWTSRPYSVLEHSVIGATFATSRVLKRAFLLHDMEESAFGDIISPVKRRFMPAAYYEEVDAWNRGLAHETKVPYSAIDGEQVHHFDAVMLAAETRTIYVGENRHIEAYGWRADIPAGGEAMCNLAIDLIRVGAFQGDRAITAFWQMWGGE